MTISRENVAKAFKYHPAKSKERIEKHNQVNDAAQTFALVIFDCVKNERLCQSAIDLVQQARMFANQGITYDEIGID